MLKRKLLAVLLSAVALGAQAAPVDAAAAKTGIPPALKSATNSGALSVVKPFKAAGGLTGWVVKESASQRNIIVFTTPDGSVLLAGMALDKDGQNLTGMYAEQYAPAADYTPAFKAFATDATGVMVGSAKAKAEITILFDANCAYCKLMAKIAAPAVDAGELRIRYIPVAILGGDSPEKGAGFLATNDAKGFITADMNGQPVEKSSDSALLAKVQKNTEMMKKFGFNGTPVVMYKSGSAKAETINVSTGLPTITEMFKKLGISGQLAKLKADPNVANYVR